MKHYFGFFLIACTALFFPFDPISAGQTDELLVKLRKGYVSKEDVPPEIGEIRSARETVGAFEMFEASFDIRARYGNPFDPDDIRVDVKIIYPSGKECLIPAFYMEPYRSRNPDATLMQYQTDGYVATGRASWTFRFASGEHGRHRYMVLVRDAKRRKTTSPEKSFSVVPSDSPGFVRVSERNPAYFENNADGSLFYGSGSNIAWIRPKRTPSEKASYEYFFGKAAENSSATRVWLCHWAWLEWMPRLEDEKTHGYAGLNYYNQRIASSLDRVFALAEKGGLRIMLCLDDNNERFLNTDSYDSWAYNPYNFENGGPAENIKSYWIDPDVRRHYKNRLRYILARWGYSTSLWTVNLWNDCTAPDPGTVEYLDDLHRYVRSVTDGLRPLVFGSNYRFEAVRVLDYSTQDYHVLGQKPIVTNECYYTRDKEWFGATLQDEIWKGLIRGDAARMVWMHELVEETDSWHVFRSFLDFISDIPLHERKFSPVSLSLESNRAEKPLTLTNIVTVAPLGDVPAWATKSPRNLFEINMKESSQFIDGFSPTLWGNRRREWKNPPTFVVELPRNGKMLVRIRELGGGTQIFTANVNGEEVKNILMENSGDGRYEPGHYIDIPLPRGRCHIKLDNAGNDWLRLHGIFFMYDTDEPCDMLDAGGWQSEDCTFIYLKNLSYGELYCGILKKKPVPVRNASARLHGLRDGKYRAVYYDPTIGKIRRQTTASVTDGSVVLDFPEIERDCAVKLFAL